MTDEIEKKKKRVAYYEANKEKIRAYEKANKERKSANNKAWREANREKALVDQKAWREANKEETKTYQKAYRETNKEKVKTYQKTYQNNRRTKDPLYKLSKNIRALTCDSFKKGGWKKNTKTQELLGCEFSFLEAHLIASAIRNYGSYSPLNEYHIDHIIPISSAKTEEEMIKLSHYSNLQFLTPSDNMSKGNRYENSNEASRV